MRASPTLRDALGVGVAGLSLAIGTWSAVGEGGSEGAVSRRRVQTTAHIRARDFEPTGQVPDERDDALASRLEAEVRPAQRFTADSVTALTSQTAKLVLSNLAAVDQSALSEPSPEPPAWRGSLLQVVPREWRCPVTVPVGSGDALEHVAVAVTCAE